MIFLVNPHSRSKGINEATILPPVGLVYIATYLRNKGFDCAIHDANIKASNPKKAAGLAINSNPRVIGVYLNSFMIDWTRAFIREIRSKDRNIPVGIGGPLASLDGAKNLAKVGADFAIAGEGEIPMAKVSENIASQTAYFEDVPGIYYRENGEIHSGPANPRIHDLDTLPFPDYSLLGSLDDYRVRAIKSPSAPIVTSRGCPFQCTFCSKAVFQSRTTFRSPENVVEEIVSLKRNMGVNQIDILDDNFTLKRSYVERVLDLLIAEDLDLVVNLQSGVRVETLDEPILLKLKRAGVRKIGYGIESADARVRTLCKKQLDIEKLRAAVITSKTLGMTVSGYFIIGLPGETRASVENTIKLAKELELDAANFAMAIPFPGTELYDYVHKHGRFLFDPEENYNYGFFASEPFYELDQVDKREMSYRFDLAYRSFYTPKKIARDMLGMRSWSELGWYLAAGVSLLRGRLRTVFDNLR
jgi:radical SAM superfamily enzyme YgiQ (UPF0313 family)